MANQEQPSTTAQNTPTLSLSLSLSLSLTNKTTKQNQNHNHMHRSLCRTVKWCPPSKAHPLPPLSPPRTPHWVATLLIDSFKSASSTYSLSQVTVRALLLSPVELGLMMKLRSAMELGSAVRWRTGRWGLGRSAMGLKVGWRNRSAMRELADELERKKN